MMRMSFFAFAALLVCGCSAHAARAPAPAPMLAAAPASAPSASLAAQLDGTQWRFVKVAGMAVPPDVTATLRFENGHASGKAGCNAYGAAYQIGADGSASFQQALSTKMACLQPAGAMQVERGVFAALRHAARIRRSGGNLVLLDESGKTLATLAPVDTTSH